MFWRPFLAAALNISVCLICFSFFLSKIGTDTNLCSEVRISFTVVTKTPLMRRLAVCDALVVIQGALSRAYTPI